jgi:hypothetical protein
MMTKRSLGRARVGLAFGVLVTSHFAFYSDFAINLNDALIAAGVARNRDEPELFQDGDEAACFEGFAPSARAAWSRAVVLRGDISPVGSFDRQQYVIRPDLVVYRRAHTHCQLVSRCGGA